MELRWSSAEDRMRAPLQSWKSPPQPATQPGEGFLLGFLARRVDQRLDFPISAGLA
jgi:hypothetical protein